MLKMLSLFALIAGIAPAWGAGEHRAIDDSVQAKVAALLGGYKPLRPIARTLEDEEVDRKGVVGRKLFQGRSLYIPQETGLVRMQKRQFAGVSVEAVLVCGLFTLESSSFAPGNDISVESRFRITSLETSSDALCRPVPGTEFSYRMQTELRFRAASGFTSRPGSLAETYDVSCKAAQEYIAARGIFEGLPGNALMVRCERKSQNGVAATFEYAFLEDSGFYLRLSEHHPGGSVKVRYTEILFRN